MGSCQYCWLSKPSQWERINAHMLTFQPSNIKNLTLYRFVADSSQNEILKYPNWTSFEQILMPLNKIFDCILFHGFYGERMRSTLVRNNSLSPTITTTASRKGRRSEKIEKEEDRETHTTSFKSITMFCGLTTFHKIFPTFILNVEYTREYPIEYYQSHKTLL